MNKATSAHRPGDITDAGQDGHTHHCTCGWSVTKYGMKRGSIELAIHLADNGVPVVGISR